MGLILGFVDKGVDVGLDHLLDLCPYIKNIHEISKGLRGIRKQFFEVDDDNPDETKPFEEVDVVIVGELSRALSDESKEEDHHCKDAEEDKDERKNRKFDISAE